MVDRLNLIANHLAFQFPFTRTSGLTSPFIAEPLQFLSLDSLFGPEINAKRAQVRAVLEERVQPILDDYYKNARFPMEVLPILRELDLLGVQQGIQGVRQQRILEFCAIVYEFARIDASLATFILVHWSLGAKTIYLHGTPQQKEKYLAKLAKFEMIGCWGLTEPDFGSDASSLQTTATPTQGGYLISGQKRWIGNAAISDIMIVYARNSQNQQIESFIVNSKAEGVNVVNVEPKLALRIVQNGQITFNNVFVPSEDKLQTTNFADGPNQVLEDSRVVVPWMAVGLIASSFERAVHYTRDRVQFNASLASMQLTQEKLARMLGIFHSCFLQCLHLTNMREQGQVDVAKSSLVKAVVTKEGREAMALGREMLGGNGVLLEMVQMKHLLDMEVLYTYEGTYDINMLVAGRAITGVPAIKSSFIMKKQ